MTPDRVASVRQTRDNLADIVERAERDEPTVITRRGKEVAAVVPIAMLREWRRWEEEKVLALFETRKDSATVSMADVLAETLARPE